MHTSSPQPDTIEKLGKAVYPSFAMLAGMKLDLFTPLKDGPMTAQQIADELGVRAAKLEPLLYALVVAGLLSVEGNQFTNTDEANEYLVRTSPNYLEGKAQYYWDRWHEVLKTAESIRTGEPQAKLDFAAMSEEELESAFSGMNSGAMAAGRLLVTRYNFSEYRTMVDIAGGSGGLSISAAQAVPDIRATVIDLPRVTPITKRFVRQADVEDRIRVKAANVLRDPLGGPYDVAVLCAFIQILSPEDARKVLNKVSRALRSSGDIFILGTGILDDSRLSPQQAVAFNLVFLNVYEEGRAYTESQHQEWLSEAGFDEMSRVTLPSGAGIIRATKG